MNKNFEEFIKSCFELAKELLDKETLTEKEQEFLKKVDLVSEKCIKV